MELTRNDIIKIFGLISAEYPSEFKTLTDEQLRTKADLWAAGLCGYTREEVLRAVTEAITESEWAPKLATIVSRIKASRSLRDKPAVELWNEIERILWQVGDAARDLRYDNTREGANARLDALYAGLDPDARLYVRSVGELIDLAEMTDEELRFEKARFLKHLPELRERTERLEAAGFGQLPGMAELKDFGKITDGKGG